jgi:hypothetical protein
MIASISSGDSLTTLRLPSLWAVPVARFGTFGTSGSAGSADSSFRFFIQR